MKVMVNDGSLPVVVALLEMFAVGRDVRITTGPKANRREIRGIVVNVEGRSLVIFSSCPSPCGEVVDVPIVNIRRLEAGGKVIELEAGVGAAFR